MELLVVGPGRLGLQLAAAAHAAGIRVRGVVGRRPPGPHPSGLPEAIPVVGPERLRDHLLHADLVLLTVPDGAIGEAAEALARTGPLDGLVVLHASGLHTSGALAPCRAAGASVGSWHPLGTFPPLGLRRARWYGLWAAVEGDPAAVEAARTLSHRLGCHPWPIDPAAKPRYHAAAAVAANLTHILVAAAIREAQAAGLPDPGAALEPLVLAACRAALEHPGLEALTGPLARGDVGTVRRHLAVLPPALGGAYRAVAALLDVEEDPEGPSGAAPSSPGRSRP